MLGLSMYGGGHLSCHCGVVMGFPYSWVNTRCANYGRTYTIPIPYRTFYPFFTEITDDYWITVDN